MKKQEAPIYVPLVECSKLRKELSAWVPGIFFEHLLLLVCMHYSSSSRLYYFSLRSTLLDIELNFEMP